MLSHSLLPFTWIPSILGNEKALLSDQAPSGRTLQSVYGAVESVASMLPQHQRTLTHDLLPAEYFKHRSAELCDFPIELVIVQDVTDSFSDDILNMRTVQLQLMVNALATSHPGSAFSVVSFRDKPLYPLGEIGDYCVRFGSPLSPNSTTIIGDYSKLATSGGGDPPESQFTSIIAASQSSTPGWGSIPLATRLIAVVTDAAPHFEGDGFNVYNLPAFSGSFDEANNDQQCIKQYYPTPSSVRSALLNRGAYLASLVYDGSYDSSLPIKSWKWFNSFLGQTDGFIHDIESDSSNFWDRLSKIITELEEVECAPSSSPVPTTAAPAASTPAPTNPEGAVTPVGTVESTASGSESCPPCLPCELPEGCGVCCREGVIIKLAYRPARLHLEVQN